jgi:hypothetical protein
MKRMVVVALMLVTAVGPTFAKTHKDMYPVSCSTLWPAVKDTLRNSGKYGILGMDSAEMTATYSMGIGSIGQKRTNSVVLNVKGDSSCEMVVQSGYSGFTNDDAGEILGSAWTSRWRSYSRRRSLLPQRWTVEVNDSRLR